MPPVQGSSATTAPESRAAALPPSESPRPAQTRRCAASRQSTFVRSVSPGTAACDASLMFEYDGAGSIDDDALTAGRAAEILVIKIFETVFADHVVGRVPFVFEALDIRLP